jgi:hypothetical protein
LVFVAVASALLIGPAPAAWGYQCAWEQIYTFDGESGGDYLGKSVSGAGDVNNDGYDDVIVGAHGNDEGGGGAGRAYVYSGQTGALLWTFTGQAASDWLGTSVSGAGDANNDGYADLIVGAPGNDGGASNAGRAYVYSGQTGGLLWTFTGQAGNDWFGTSVSGAGDVNNDSYDDVIVGANGNDAGGGGAGRAYVYSGQTGGLLWTFTGAAALDWFGLSVSGAGDVNNDGYADLMVGAINNDGGGSNAGRAYVYSGQTGGLLWSFDGESSDDGLGYSVSGAGDVDQDGYDDLIAGAWQCNYGGDGTGRAYVYSGLTGELIHTFTGEAEQNYFGVSVSGAGDVNSDGYDDLVVGAYHNNAGGSEAGRAYVYSGRTEVMCFTGLAEGDQLGYSVSGAGDVNNDGYDDVVVGVPFSDRLTTDAGYMWVYSGYTGNWIAGGASASAGDLFGASVSGAGDVNDDGYADWIVGVPFNDGGGNASGRAVVYSGPVGNQIWAFTGGAAGDQFGSSVSGAGDSDGDGYDDLVVGAPYYHVGSPEMGRVYVYSGQTGSEFIPFIGSEGDRFGLSVSGAGDVNNDGYDDAIAGAPYNDAGGTDAGRAYVWSPPGSWLWTFTGEAADDLFGHSVSGVGDVNDDGYDDCIVGAPLHDAGGMEASGRAYVYSGESGNLIHTFPGESSQDRFGYSVSGAGDVNYDGYDDLVVGAPYNDATAYEAGRSYVFCGRTGALLCVFDGEAAGDHFGYSVSGAGQVRYSFHATR